MQKYSKIYEHNRKFYQNSQRKLAERVRAQRAKFFLGAVFLPNLEPFSLKTMQKYSEMQILYFLPQKVPFSIRVIQKSKKYIVPPPRRYPPFTMARMWAL